MNLKNSDSESRDCSPIVLKIHGLGHVPSFKNSKMIARGRLITDPKKQKWMERAIQSFESQLNSLFQTAASATETGLTPPYRIASSLPLDDNLDWIPEHSVKWRMVSKGNEGAIITIERIR